MHTARLVMRRWRESDREPYAAMNADPEVMRYFPARPDRAASDAAIDRMEDLFDRQGSGLSRIAKPQGSNPQDHSGRDRVTSLLIRGMVALRENSCRVRVAAGGCRWRLLMWPRERGRVGQDGAGCP